MARATLKRPDRATSRWVRNASDELAAAKGCRFDEGRGQFVVDWIQKYCRLYEGEYAGQALELRDWQLECTMRLFGWVVFSERWGREIRRFRQASVWIAKKNKKSPTLSAWGLYLLAGDGEQGQKVFLAAKDGMQAREIAGKHAVEMLAQSADLQRECQLNRNLLQITHLPTRSIMRPLSSSNSRTQESKEGINGCVLIDETHVVDREFVNRISRAGISRSEPLHIEVSTAGNNPDGYGRERFDRALAVERGDIEDQKLFAAIYAAPQDLTEAALAKDPLKYARMANPALGHTVDAQELLDDYTQSKHSIRLLADCLMYRFNVWQRSANPWLRGSDWEQCKRSYTEEDLAGQDCYAGLDLSKTQDMSALVLAFPQGEEEIKLLPYFWLPEAIAKERGHLAPFEQWARSGVLELTPGSVIDYGFIRARFRRLAEQFRILELLYDRTYAEETTQALEQGVLDDRGQVIEEGTGVPRSIFKQTLMEFTSPCKDFERLVIAGKLHHNGHPILTWQAGHVRVRTDPNQNIRPVKPPRDDVKKIDGIVAAIMALAGAFQRPQESSIYETQGLTTI